MCNKFQHISSDTTEYIFKHIIVEHTMKSIISVCVKIQQIMTLNVTRQAYMFCIQLAAVLCRWRWCQHIAWIAWSCLPFDLRHRHVLLVSYRSFFTVRLHWMLVSWWLDKHIISVPYISTCKAICISSTVSRPPNLEAEKFPKFDTHISQPLSLTSSGWHAFNMQCVVQQTAPRLLIGLVKSLCKCILNFMNKVCLTLMQQLPSGQMLSIAHCVQYAWSRL